MTIFDLLNHIIWTMFVVSSDGPVIEIKKDDTNIFGVGASMEDSLHSLVISKVIYPFI